MNKNALWMLVGCVVLVILLWALAPSIGGASWPILLMLFICIFGACLPALFRGKGSCHKEKTDAAKGSDDAKRCH